MASYDEVTATPVKAETVFEMQLNTNEPHIPIIIQTAQVSPKERVRLRCRVSGAVNADNPNLFWVFRGDYLQETDLLSIESNQQQRESSLRISEFREEHVGQYECNVKRVDNKFHKTKLQLRTRPDSNHSSSLTDEVPCEPPLNTTYCQNGGVCRMHVVSKSKSCKCHSGFIGKQCEYDEVQIDNTKHKIYSAAEYQRGMIMMGTVFGVVLLILLVCFLYAQRGKSRRNRNQATFESAGPHALSAIHSDLELRAGLREYGEEHSLGLLTQQHALCANCKNTMTSNRSGLSSDVFTAPDGLSNYAHATSDNAPVGGRPSSLPASPFVSFSGMPREFLPFDPHCMQCLAEWRNFNFSFPGPTGQGLHYASVQPRPVISRDFSIVFPAKATPETLQRLKFGKKERHNGVSDETASAVPVPENLNQAGVSGLQNCAEPGQQSLHEAAEQLIPVQRSSSHEHQSPEHFLNHRPPSITRHRESRKGVRSVRFLKQPHTSQQEEGVIWLPESSQLQQEERSSGPEMHDLPDKSDVQEDGQEKVESEENEEAKSPSVLKHVELRVAKV